MQTSDTRRPEPVVLISANSRRILGKVADFDSETPARLRDPERFRLAFEDAGLGIALVDLAGNIFEANRACSELFGRTNDELIRLNILDIWVPEDRVEAMAEFRNAARGSKANAAYERRYRNKKGEIVFAEVMRRLVQSQSGTPMFFVATFRDITETKRLQAMLEERASTDPLTGAMNRLGIEERVGYELMRSDRYGDKLSLVLIDLDHFKVVNDTYGHLAGDRILRGFCDIARSCLRSTDSLGRVGGEEFVALLSETGMTGAQIFAERLRSTLADFRFDGDIRITASMGVAAHRKGEELSSLMERADCSMYRAKQSGRNRVVLDSGDVEREEARKVQGHDLNLHWKSSYLSGQPLIDAEHQELFRLVNLILVAMSDEEAEKRVLPLVHELFEHIQTHFTHEEELLRAAGFPGAEAHAAMHRELAERACGLIRLFELGQDSAGNLLGFLIQNVVARHMLRDDCQFSPWVRAKRA